jgi:hypothetical protein
MCLTRIASLMLAGVTVFSVGSVAFSQNSGGMPKDVQIPYNKWGACLGEAIRSKIRTNLKPNELFEFAEQRCAPLEQVLLTAVSHHDGNRSRKELELLKAKIKPALLSSIVELRSTAIISDPEVAWGNCLGQYARSRAETSDSTDEIFQAGLQQCKSYEEKTLADLKKQLPAPQIQSQMDTIRSGLKDVLTKNVEATRAARK